MIKLRIIGCDTKNGTTPSISGKKGRGNCLNLRKKKVKH